MIYLDRPIDPYNLSKLRRKKLIRKYIQSLKDGNEIAVWKYTDIKEPLKIGLLKMTNDKCAYCECMLEVGSYMEPDHFYDKKRYPTSVVSWKNFLPSCKKCNSKSGKGTHDVKAEPIINPSKDRPNEHLYYKNYSLLGDTSKGKMTVKVLKLNDMDRLIKPRKKIIETLFQQIDDMYEEVLARQSTFNVKMQFTEKIQRQVRSFLLKGGAKSAFSAIYATELLDNANFSAIRTILINAGLWTDSISAAYDEAQSNRFCRAPRR